MKSVNGKIFLLEDEKNVGATLSERLVREGFDVVWRSSTQEALLAARDHVDFDLALLDVGLPDGTGFDVAQFFRQSRPSTAVVFLTAFGNPEDRIRGLELGAEDYVVKPFNFQELMLRIKNALKRARYLLADPYEGNERGKERGGSGVLIGGARVFFDRLEVEKEGSIERLTHKEAAVLKLMVERRGQVVSRDEILDYAWSSDEFPTPRTVDNFIMRLRRLVEPHPEKSDVIRSIRGIGYQLS